MVGRKKNIPKKLLLLLVVFGGVAFFHVYVLSPVQKKTPQAASIAEFRRFGT